MKKVMAIFGAALLLAGVATSCNKKCECKTYALGVVTKTYDIELESGKKCADYSALVTEDPKSGIECKSKLFSFVFTKREKPRQCTAAFFVSLPTEIRTL